MISHERGHLNGVAERLLCLLSRAC